MDSILCAALSAIFIFQIAAFLLDPSYRASISKQMEEKTHSGKVYDRVVSGLIPRTRREKGYFTTTALAAGVCEEIVFRGFLLYLMRRIFPEASLFFLAALAGLGFWVYCLDFYILVQILCSCVWQFIFCLIFQLRFCAKRLSNPSGT